MRKYAFIFVALLLLLTACTPAAVPTPTPSSPIRIGTNPWAGYAPIYIAYEQGFFAEEGVQVELTNYIYSEALTALAQRNLDGNTMVFSDAMGLASAGVNVQFVWVTDYSAGGDALVSNASITSIEDLRGKRVGFSIGTYSHIFVASVLAQAGMTLDDIQIVQTIEAEIPAKLAAGEIDAGHTYDPFLTEAIEQGANVLRTSADTPGVIVDGLFIHQQIVESRPADVQAIVRAMQRALIWWGENPEAGNADIAKWLEIAPEDVPSYLAGVRILTLEENLVAFDPATEGPESLLVIGQLAVDLFTDAGVLQNQPDVNTLINGSFVNALQSR